MQRDAQLQGLGDALRPSVNRLAAAPGQISCAVDWNNASQR
jgi:hypothetical protein